jgi:hypothetical protein
MLHGPLQPAVIRITIPVVFHVIHDGTEGNVPDALLDAQLQVLNDGFRGTGFSFMLQSINRVESKKWFTGCFSNQNFKKELAVDPAHTLNFYTCNPKGTFWATPTCHGRTRKRTITTAWSFCTRRYRAAGPSRTMKATRAPMR